MQEHGRKYFYPQTPHPSPQPPDLEGLGLKVKIQLFQNMVVLHTKLKGMTHAIAW